MYFFNHLKTRTLAFIIIIIIIFFFFTKYMSNLVKVQRQK